MLIEEVKKITEIQSSMGSETKWLEESKNGLDMFDFLECELPSKLMIAGKEVAVDQRALKTFERQGTLLAEKLCAKKYLKPSTFDVCLNYKPCKIRG